MTYAVEFDNVSRLYGDVRAVDGVSIAIKDGEFFSMLGPSGSGKTTCLRLIAGFEQLSGGAISIFGKPASNLPPWERDVNTVFQDYALFPHMSILDNVAYGLMVKGVNKKQRHAMAQEALEKVALGFVQQRKPSQLSGGQRQRVAIARALVNEPRVLLLDEPLGALDLKLREQMQLELKKLQQSLGITFIFVTHDQDEAMSISDMIVVMKDGIVQQIGKPQNVYDDPVNLFVAKFLGTPPINVFSGEVKNEQLYIGSEAVLSTPGVADQSVHVGIRPEGFVLKEDGPLSCDLVRLEVMGRDVSIVSTHEKSQNVTIRSIIDADEGRSLPTGKVHFALKPAKVFLFSTDTEERIRF